MLHRELPCTETHSKGAPAHSDHCTQGQHCTAPRDTETQRRSKARREHSDHCTQHCAAGRQTGRYRQLTQRSHSKRDTSKRDRQQRDRQQRDRARALQAAHRPSSCCSTATFSGCPRGPGWNNSLSASEKDIPHPSQTPASLFSTHNPALHQVELCSLVHVSLNLLSLCFAWLCTGCAASRDAGCASGLCHW